MNKALHVLIYVFLILAGAGLFFEIQLNAKRAELTDRNRIQEDYLVKIAKTVERTEADKTATFEIQKDASPVEAKLVDIPDMDNLLADYPAPLEQATNLETYNWDPQSSRAQLRQTYVMGPDGKPEMDGNEPLKRGPGTEDELLGKLFESAKAQQSRLNSTRAALTELRGKLESVVAEINKLKPEARQDKVTIVEQKDKIGKLEGEKADLENQITKLKSSIDERDAEITSLKDEVQTEKDNVAEKQEELEKSQKLVDQLKKALASALQNAGAKSVTGATISSLPIGDKGKIVKVDNENMFAVVEFSAEAMKELKGEDGGNQMPLLELSLRRDGYNGVAGEFIGRVRIRQEVKGKNLAVCDILTPWEQDKAAVGDIVFAD